ncbi:hypothetical protein KGF56_004748 [Candida oxycetoniae]|uniref:Proteasome chaperone 3 n=1 Tax=Candida oxycetoniae TaxID=497107 RepID=A0AAI9WW00_9ASCO|nr:uncharacterized protein KGF56_004748 [Candida oxycetoniae]KAI3402451.1 hypothetical protein KGF56_004748 [Candida oxycetoniae]
MRSGSLQFDKTQTATFPNSKSNEQFFFHLLEFQNKLVLNISVDGVLDTTFKLPISTKRTINYESMMDLNENDDSIENEYDFQIEPQLLIGDHANMKIAIIAGQVAKLISTQKPKETILSIGTRWLGKGDQVEENDLAKLTFILENVKKLL